MERKQNLPEAEMTENTFSQWLSGLDFEYRSTGQHKIEAPALKSAAIRRLRLAQI